MVQPDYTLSHNPSKGDFRLDSKPTLTPIEGGRWCSQADGIFEGKDDDAVGEQGGAA
jgi:hypothetical protein